MDRKPIPAFYCCYLLRSINQHSSLYVGSTPNPIRRLAQHNGLSKGGAVRTARTRRRPWEMTCIVSGFPSHIAALQFEWAWQNTHVTKRIADEQRITARETKVKTSPKTGRTRKRLAQPRTSLTDKLSNLHLLLRVPSFARWPLQVRFFCEDVYQMWQRWSERVDGEIRGGIKIFLDVKQVVRTIDGGEIPMRTQAKGKLKREAIGNGGIEGLNVGYSESKCHVEKSIFLLGGDEVTRCAVCSEIIGPSAALALVCPAENCKAVSHMSCLAPSFLVDEGGRSAIVPTSGKCPKCRSELQWVDLVKEMSLRANGEKEVAQLMKKPRERKAKVPKSSKAKSSHSKQDKFDEEDDDQAESSVEDAFHAGTIEDDALPDDWYYQGDEDDMTSAASGFSDGVEAASPKIAASLAAPKSGVVVEDSEWDEKDLLD